GRRLMGRPLLVSVAVATVLAAGCAGRAAAPQLPPAATPAPPPVAAEAVVPLPPLPPAAEPAPLDPTPTAPLLVRVGLALDLARVELPCCSQGLRLSTGAETSPLLTPVTVEPAAERVEAAVYRLQVAALSDRSRAGELARSLGERHGMPAKAVWDEAAGLHRVRLGRFASREAAELARSGLEAGGLAGSWVVGEGGELTGPAMRLTSGGRTLVAAGRWLRVSAPADGSEAVAHAGRRYRGDLLVYLNSRGLLNVINELSLEDYLRGVVPGEMGPEQYPRLEALKAQAVAARTYALRNLGEFLEEGYDICATPRCQVYHGLTREHPLSDRAVAETEGQVLIHRGELVDARYSATCGGHTEDGAVVFPHAHAPYLQGVPCVETGMTVVEGGLLEGEPFPEALTHRLLPPAPSRGAAGPGAAIAARLDLLARRLPPRPVVVPASTAGSDVAAPTAAWLRRQIERRWGAGPGEAAVGGIPPGRALESGEVEAALLRLAVSLGLVEERRATFLDRRAGSLRLRGAAGGEESWPLPAGIATFRRRGAGRFATDLALLPGDPLTLWVAEGRLVALVQEVDPRELPFDRPPQFASWTRARSDRELAHNVDGRYPGLGFRSLEVVSHGVSGRVAALRIHGSAGRSVEVQGLAVRWVLELPDTRFTVERTAGGYVFRGSGWGHGVGMCQVGSFGMAGRGHDYRSILDHYYRDVELVRVRREAPRWSEPALVGLDRTR
ncbi:MAG TPA: SpoIID/LytB domain-containing protein, partial [Thermoanaerobaculia bacterium]|nr:SpoIID/LytB domain-containing protein [Thermoanaerobaculia bacterium]